MLLVYTIIHPRKFSLINKIVSGTHPWRIKEICFCVFCPLGKWYIYTHTSVIQRMIKVQNIDYLSSSKMRPPVRVCFVIL